MLLILPIILRPVCGESYCVFYSAKAWVTATERWCPPVHPTATTKTVLPSSLYDLVFDVRFMPNPFYIDSMRNKTGLDKEVRDYVFSFKETGQFLEKCRLRPRNMVDSPVPPPMATIFGPFPLGPRYRIFSVIAIWDASPW